LREEKRILAPSEKQLTHRERINLLNVESIINNYYAAQANTHAIKLKPVVIEIKDLVSSFLI